MRRDAARRRRVPVRRLSQVALLTGLALTPQAGVARTWRFNPDLLGPDGRQVDIDRFNRGGQLPGRYVVDVVLNGAQVDTQNIAFSATATPEDATGLRPCLTVAQLSGYGVRVEDYPGLGTQACANLAAIPGATWNYLFDQQQLQLSVPQVSMRPVVRGIAPQALWDDGVPAVLLNWRASASRTTDRQGREGPDTQQWLQLSPGANLGPWRLRNQMNWQKTAGQEGHWQSLGTRAERGISRLHSRLTLGERSTPGEVFDAVPFRGVMLGSDDDMVPYSQRAFAPVVRGIARSPARIEVRQQGYLIYSTTVAPGPFALTDLSPGASGGDLQVTVRESDGPPQVFTVPWQTPAIALKEGYLRYSAMAGEYRPADRRIDSRPVGEVTVMYGLPWSLTAYAGVQGAEHIHSGALGMGVSAGRWGALSLDVTGSHGQRQGASPETGTAWRLRYSQTVVRTGTALTFSHWRYGRPGYLTLSDVLDTWCRHGGDCAAERGEDARDRSALTLSQPVGMAGSLSLNASRTTLPHGHESSLGVGYGIGLPMGISLSLDWSQSRQACRDGDCRTDRLTSLSLSVPLGRNDGHNMQAYWQATSPFHGDARHELGVSGEAFDRQLNWSVSQYQDRGDRTRDGRGGNLRLGWDGRYGEISGSRSQTPYSATTGLDAQGGLVLYRQGLVAGQSLSDTVALVDVPGAPGVSVGGWPGVRTGPGGRTLQPWLVPYQKNTVSLNTVDMPDDVDVLQTDRQVVPTQGAVVPVVFPVRRGGRAILTLTQPDGRSVPFGAMATSDMQGTGVTGSQGQLWMTGLNPQGTVTVTWAGGRCRVHYRLPAQPGPGGIYTLSAVCEKEEGGS